MITPALETFEARPPIHVSLGVAPFPQGLTPTEIKSAYHLPKSGGFGKTIAIITAYHHAKIESDLAAFDKAFKLNACTIKNHCLEVKTITSADGNVQTDTGWDMETALDTEWAHALAPQAKILVVEAAKASGSALLKALDYATNRPDAISISMSWGGPEFPTETSLESHFEPNHLITFVAASGDDGTGASWPAASAHVIAVGGTSLLLNNQGKFVNEKAWTGSGGGVSSFIKEPNFQTNYDIPRAQGNRAIPDVSFAADPAHGFSVYHAGGWYVVGGTSAGAPAWAAIASLNAGTNYALNPIELYIDKAGSLYNKYFRDITSGNNGSCGYYCKARAHYDYVTGLGSPVTYRF